MINYRSEKVTNSGAYVSASNDANLRAFGLKDREAFIGKTVIDLDQWMRPCWGDRFVYQIQILDQHVCETGQTITSDPYLFLDIEGFLHIHQMTKIPIINTHQTVAAILTTSCELTNRIDRWALFQGYKTHYIKKHTACAQFIRHLGINRFFKVVLSERELECLLHMVINNSYKRVAERMHRTLKTVETHVTHIQHKLAAQYVLSHVLEYLRNGYRADSDYQLNC